MNCSVAAKVGACSGRSLDRLAEVLHLRAR
jgi:hypothetical protein